jgi:hypothetical protein
MIARGRGAATVLVAVLLGTAPAFATAAAAADPPPLPGLGLLVPPPDPAEPDPPDAEEPDLPGIPEPQDSDGDEAAAAAEQRVREAIVALAGSQPGRRRAAESGNNCSWYNAAVEPAGRRCGVPWCMQFLRWVWREAGAEVTGLTYRPASLRAYGRGHGTWHPGAKLAGIRPGDAVVFRLDRRGDVGHATIVIAVRGKRVTTIGGNERDGVRRMTWRIGVKHPYGRVSGYTSPVPRG